MKKWTKFGLFAGGVLFGTAGIKILSGRTAKKVYTHATAATLRAADDVMKTATKVKEEAGDILADAKKLNETYAAMDAKEVIEDTAENKEPKVPPMTFSAASAVMGGGNPPQPKSRKSVNYEVYYSVRRRGTYADPCGVASHESFPGGYSGILSAGA